MRDQALDALAAGDLDTAATRAAAAIALDQSNLTLRAREVLFDVALMRGELSRASSELSLYAAQPNRPDSADAWLHRSQERLQAEIAAGWADVDGARAAVERIQALEPLEPVEQAWLEQLNWRLAVRVPEQARDLNAMATALAAARRRPSLSAMDDLWLEGTARRLDVLQAEWACETTDAREALARMQGVKGLREPDQRWAALAGMRIDLRALDANDGDAMAKVRLNEIAATTGLPESERAWVRGYWARLDLKEALASGDQDAIALLRSSYEQWAAWEPPCARLVIPDGPVKPPREEPDEPGPWVRVGALGGVQGWRTHLTKGSDPDDELETGHVLAGAAGADLALAWPLWRGLGLRGDVMATPALAPSVVGSGDVVVGREAIDGALGVVWMHPQWELFAGAEVTHLRFSATYDEERLQGWNTEILPRLGLAGELPLGPGSARAEVAGGWLSSAWSADLRLGYGLGQASLRPVAGLEGRIAGGSNAGLFDKTASEPADVAQLDWIGAVVLGVEWRPTW